MAVNTWAKNNIGGSSKTGASGSESSGGGGGGDFSLAEVTIVNNSTKNLSFYIPRVLDIHESDYDFSGTSTATGTISRSDSMTCLVVLYKGSAYGQSARTDVNVTVTGDIEYDDGDLVITGGGTITVTDSQ